MEFRPYHAGALAAMLLLVALSPTLLLTQRLAEDGSVASLADRSHSFTLSRLRDLDPAKDALVLRAPAVGYSSQEVQLVRHFLSEGGGVLLLDDIGSGSDLLVRLGVGMELSPARVFTPGFETTPDRIVGVDAGALVGMPPEVVFTRPVAVVGGTPLLVTPDLGWIDLNDNLRADIGEPLAITTLAAIQTVGRGTLVVVGDPDLLGPDAPDPVKTALLHAVAPSGVRLVFDEGHARLADPLGINALLAGRLTPVQQTAMLMVGAALAALAVLGPRVITPRRRTPLRISGPDAKIAQEALAELDPT